MNTNAHSDESWPSCHATKFGLGPYILTKYFLEDTTLAVRVVYLVGISISLHQLFFPFVFHVLFSFPWSNVLHNMPRRVAKGGGRISFVTHIFALYLSYCKKITEIKQFLNIVFYLVILNH